MKPIEALNKYFGYDSFRDGQEVIINNIVEGKNVLAVLATGAGKSICYQVPALMSKTFAIVISPLIALMQDQVTSINATKRTAAFINSSLDYYSAERVLQNISGGQIKLLYLAPEKLENREFAAKIKSLNPEYIFVDEAHCISEWGHSFRPSYTRLKEFCEFTGIKKISAFTATATPAVRKDIVAQLGLEKPKVFVKGFERKNLALNVVHTTYKKEKTLEIIKALETPAIIYSSTRKEAEEISNYLKLNKLDADFYHAGLSTELRKIIQDDFLSGRKKIITATNAFGMGIDKEDIRLIIHTSIPSSIENYYQEIGRAGRDGEEANVVLLSAPKDKHIQQFILSNSFADAKDIKFVYTALCDSAGIAIGSKNDKPIIFDEELHKYFRVNDYSESKINAALSVLESAGYIQVQPVLNRKSNVRFLLEKNKLREYTRQLNNSYLKEVIIFMLKRYGIQILEHKIYFDLNTLAEEMKTHPAQFTDALNNLYKFGIISFYKPSGFREIDLQHGRINSYNLKLDEEEINRRKETAEAKLNSMVDFTKSQQCRLSVVLNYFGQSASGYKCGKCDNCTGNNLATSISINYLQEIIVQTVHESVGRVRKSELIKILRGTSQKHYAKDFTTFGACALYDIRDLENSIDHLMKDEVIYLDSSFVYLGERGKDLITEEVVVEPENNNADNRLELYEKLNTARKEAASKFTQPAELICSDETLREIARIKPKSAEALMSIEGFKRRAYNKVGEELLEIIKEYKPEGNKNSENKSKNLPKDISKTYELINKGYSIEEISNLIKAPESIVSIQIETIIEFEPELKIETLIPKDEFRLIFDEIKKGSRNLKEIKQNIPSNISYAKIRVLLAKHLASSSRH